MALEAYIVRRRKTMNPATINLASLGSRRVGIAQAESALAKLRRQAGETREGIDLMFQHTNGKSSQLISSWNSEPSQQRGFVQESASAVAAGRPTPPSQASNHCASISKRPRLPAISRPADVITDASDPPRAFFRILPKKSVACAPP